MSSVIDGDVQITHQAATSKGAKGGAPKAGARKRGKNTMGATQHAGPNGGNPKRDTPPCVICKSADHAMTACPSYDKDHNKNRKGKGKGKGKGSSK
jgi:hypothetical protein